MTDSQLVVDGTASEPVVFEPAAGADDWDSNPASRSAARASRRISHAVLQSAGSSPTAGAATTRAAITVEPNDGVPATPTIDNTVIAGSNGYGITFADTTHCGGPAPTTRSSARASPPIRMHGNFVGRFGPGNALAGNNTSGTFGHDGFWVVGDVVNTTATWPRNDVPYMMHGDFELRQSNPFDTVPIWTIEPGSELRFASDGRLRVGEGNDGVLDARAPAPIRSRFTSMDIATPAFWRGIDFCAGLGRIDSRPRDRFLRRSAAPARATSTSEAARWRPSGSCAFMHSEEYAAVIYAGSAPMFTGPSTDRLYVRNGQASVPGAGDPSFDCVRDATAGTCTQL